MVFFDTCVWIELCSVKTPESENEKKQASAASKLLLDMSSDEVIITCKEQLLEIISAVQKVKMREYNKKCKKSHYTVQEV